MRNNTTSEPLSPENGATNPQSQISENVEAVQVYRYTGEDYLLTCPTRNEIVAVNDDGLTIIL